MRDRLPYCATVPSCMLSSRTQGLPSRESYEVGSDLPGVARTLQKMSCSQEHVHGLPDTLWKSVSLINKIHEAMSQPKARSVYAVGNDEQEVADDDTRSTIPIARVQDGQSSYDQGGERSRPSNNSAKTLIGS